MIPKHKQFVEAVQQRRRIWIKFYSKPDGGTVERTCAPMEYGLGAAAGDGVHRYWIWDCSGGAGCRALGLLPDQIMDLTVLGVSFDPSQFVERKSVPSTMRKPPAAVAPIVPEETEVTEVTEAPAVPAA